MTHGLLLLSLIRHYNRTMKAFLYLFISLFFLSCSEQAEKNSVQTKTKAMTRYTILALGDSLTEGLGVANKDNYPSQLQKLLPDDVKVINAGLSGETSAGLLNRLNWVLQQKPDLTILTIGANDAMRGIPVDFTQKNIDEIITRIKASHSKVILSGMQIYNNLGQKYVQDFKNIYPQLAEKHQIPLIPFFLEHIAGQVKYNQDDGLHPNALGYQIIVEKNILPAVKQIINSKNP